MDFATYPFSKDIVLIGGGHTHALVLRAWGMNPLPGARLTLINPAPTAPYTGMLPGYVAGHYTRDELEIDLVRLSRFAKARLVFGLATAIDRDAKQIHVAGRAPIGYDIASIDIGITSAMPEIDGFSDHAIAAKPLGPFARKWAAHLDAGGGSVALIGGGIAGIELALAARHAMGPSPSIHLIDHASILRGVGRGTATHLRQALAEGSVTIIEDATVRRVDAGKVHLSDGRDIPANLTIGAAGARPFPWLETTGLKLQNGYISVDDRLRSVSDPAVFAVGDCAHLSFAPRPKAGVFAVRAAPALTQNLKAALSQIPYTAFSPQKHYLKLISLGPKSAIADKWGQALSGAWAWRWKDKIDRAFMNKLNNPPFPDNPTLPLERAEGMDTLAKPLCQGCGAKVGAPVLNRVLSDLPSVNRKDVETGPGDDAAVLSFGNTKQVLTVDHLSSIWNDPWLFGKIAANHALGDIWAMGASPQAALAEITLPRMTPDLQERWLREVLAAAASVFNDEGADIVGGHTTQGASFTVGFSITGLLNSKPHTLTGAKPGDLLLLTRPIGSGTLFAAEMQGKARGTDIATLLNTLSISQGKTARALVPYASAMTDVTGFGLAGHAMRLAAASRLAAVLHPRNVPFFSGANDLARTGVKSSLWDSNFKATGLPLQQGTAFNLMFDPQTAGGFLAAIPKQNLGKLETTLNNLGQSFAIIGRLEPGPPGQLVLE